MACEVSTAPLSLRVLVERRAAIAPCFVLDVSLVIPSGITILFGASGAGKSTLLDCIAGLLQPDAGHIKTGDDTLFDSVSRVNVPRNAAARLTSFNRSHCFPT